MILLKELLTDDRKSEELINDGYGAHAGETDYPDDEEVMIVVFAEIPVIFVVLDLSIEILELLFIYLRFIESSAEADHFFLRRLFR